MRYILNDEGYIEEIAFGVASIECKDKTCTEYTGEIPTGYASLQEWASKEIDKLNAWKIIEGNLVFDNAKYLELKELWEKQAEDNRPVYHKEIFEMKQQIEDISDISESQYQKATATGKVITVDNVKKAYPKVKITDINPYSFSKVDLIATGKNLLKNEAVLQKIDGVNFTPNRDRSITIQGTTATTNKTATGTNVEINIEYNIAGTSSNTSAFLCFKKGINYYLSGLENQKIKMYYFNGTDRTEIYSGSGGAIKFTDSDKLVTQIVLITGGSSSKLTIYPMLVIGTSAAPYETYTSSMLSIDFKEYIESGFFLGSNTFLGSNAFLKGTKINYILIEKNTIYVSVNNEEHKIGSGNVILFDGYDVLYTMQDTTLEVNYCINALEVDNLDFMRGKKTTTNKFKVLADGSIEAHDGNFSGTVTATAGKIGGCEISDGKLQVPSANISGTLSADKINGGTITASTIKLEGVSLSPSASKLGGWSASSNRLYSNSSKVASSLYSNGNFILGGNYGMAKFDTNPVRITTADKLLISDSYSASEMANSNDTISIRAFSGTVHINSNYGVYAGSNRLDGSSSRAIKENIKPIDPKYVDEIYKEVNKMPLYTYDYLDKYGDKDDFGFIIEDIENTCLNRTLKINKNPDDEKVKNYGTLELNKMNLLLIKELMKKNEELENRIKDLERKC